MTPKQKKLFDYIRYFTDENGVAPTMREIQHHFGFKSISSVQHFLGKLEEEGFLKREFNTTRSAKIANRSEALDVPLLGMVAAGLPIEAIENDSNYSVPAQFIKEGNDYFCLKVTGDSMIDEHILDKDIVLIRRTQDCKNGDIIVGVVDGKATLKKFKKIKNRIELIPANDKYKPIIVTENNDFRVAGVLAGLFRF